MDKRSRSLLRLLLLYTKQKREGRKPDLLTAPHFSSFHAKRKATRRNRSAAPHRWCGDTNTTHPSPPLTPPPPIPPPHSPCASPMRASFDGGAHGPRAFGRGGRWVGCGVSHSSPDGKTGEEDLSPRVVARTPGTLFTPRHPTNHRQSQASDKAASAASGGLTESRRLPSPLSSLRGGGNGGRRILVRQSFLPRAARLCASPLRHALLPAPSCPSLLREQQSLGGCTAKGRRCGWAKAEPSPSHHPTRTLIVLRARCEQ